jgi:L-lactate dehydrogenase complex protein LldF
MRTLRERTWREQLVDRPTRWGLRLWGAVARRPALYRLASRTGVAALRLWARRAPALRRLPGAGAWTRSRDMAAPEPGGTFMARYRRGER